MKMLSTLLYLHRYKLNPIFYQKLPKMMKNEPIFLFVVLKVQKFNAQF